MVSRTTHVVEEIWAGGTSVEEIGAGVPMGKKL
jgi:hypothetical protein